MQKIKTPKTFNPQHLYTQNEYAKKILGKGRSRVNQLVKAELLPVVEINGAKLIYHNG